MDDKLNGPELLDSFQEQLANFKESSGKLISNKEHLSRLRIRAAIAYMTRDAQEKHLADEGARNKCREAIGDLTKVLKGLGMKVEVRDYDVLDVKCALGGMCIKLADAVCRLKGSQKKDAPQLWQDAHKYLGDVAFKDTDKAKTSFVDFEYVAVEAARDLAGLSLLQHVCAGLWQDARPNG